MVPRWQNCVHVEAPADRLCTIRLNVTVDGRTLKDSFQWNVDDPMTAAQFARSLCYDLDLNQNFEAKITETMEEQIGSFTLSHLRLDVEQRVPIRLEIRIGHQILRDQFEWDMGEPANDPETFARSLCADLALGPEYATEVAQSIREQLNEHASELLSRGKIREQDHYIVASRAIRQPHELAAWEPSLDDMTEQELIETKKDEEREARIAARESRKTGGGSRGRGAIQAPSSGSQATMVELDGSAVMANFRKGRPGGMPFAMQRLSGSTNPFGRAGYPPEYVQLREMMSAMSARQNQLRLAGQRDESLEAQMVAVNERMNAVIAAHTNQGR